MLKEDILRLRNEGKSYNEIAELLGCSKGTISYHCSDDVKEYYRRARRRNRKKFTTELKLKYGGKCSKCGYNKCLEALQFHHRDPLTKTKIRKYNGQIVGVTHLAQLKSQKVAIEEARKCDLICANCHVEEHVNLRNVV